MTSWRHVVHFFVIVAPVPRLMRTTVWGVTACAAAMVAWDASRAVMALTPILLLQLFATSSGFMLSARRGHYDLLLTRGHSRQRIAVVHWVMCAWPGTLAWMVLAATEAIVSGGSRITLLRAGTLAAVLVVSTMPWAVTVALPRFAGAVGWLVTLALLAMVRAPHETTHGLRPVDASAPVLEAVVALVLYPPLMVGQLVEHASGIRLIGAMGVGAVSVACALAWIERQDIPLESSQ